MIKRDLHNKNNNLIIRSDNGPQFISFYFQNTCADLELEHERIPYATPNKNAHIGSFHRILEDECLSRYDFESFADAYRIVSRFIKAYNKNRIHSSIGYLCPEEYYAKVISGNEKKQVIRL